MAYWYNVSTGEVEQDEATSRKENLLGPYDTPEQAAQALELARQRTAEWDERERREAAEEGRD